MRKPTPIHYCENTELGAIKSYCKKCKKQRVIDIANGAKSKALFIRQPKDLLDPDHQTSSEVLVAKTIESNLRGGNYGRCQFCGTVYNPRSTSVCPLCRREGV